MRSWWDMNAISLGWIVTVASSGAEGEPGGPLESGEPSEPNKQGEPR